MNQHCYRLVFNAARGQVMVVGETAGAVDGRFDSTPSPKSSKQNKLNKPKALIKLRNCAIKSIAYALLTLSLGVSITATAQTQIKADPSAPGNQRPTVLTAPNGVPLVNIQTPSAAGVSRNTYSQFDVQPQGAILNNSRVNTPTQLGGWVQGNPWLAGGPARVILNEVNSSSPSQLRGYVEVAGPRTEVIIANPAGIQVNGGGFINASRVTLSTGPPVLGPSGAVSGFRVQQGVVSLEGLGLDASTTDYATILARAAQINAGLWANYLQVIAGTHQISVDANGKTIAIPLPSTAINPDAPPGNVPEPPQFAIDTKLLGGMYAGHIFLVGGPGGLGVSNAGSMYVRAGEFFLSAEGKIINSGTLQAVGDVKLAATSGIDNSGQVQAGGALDLTAQTINNSATGQLSGSNTRITANTSLTNRGLIDGQRTLLSAPTINNIGTGRIYGDTLSIAADTLNNTPETLGTSNPVTQAPVAPVIASRDRLDIGVGTLNNSEQALIYSAGDLALGGALDTNQRATGQALALNNASATIEAGGSADINAQTVNNRNLHFGTTTQTLAAQSLTEYQGAGAYPRYAPGTPGVYIYNAESDYLHTPEGDYENWSAYNYTRSTTQTRITHTEPGQILSGREMRLTADSVNNDNSQIMAGGAITGTIGSLNNSQTAGERITTDTGSVTAYWRNYQRGRDSTGSSTAPYNPAPTVQAIALAPAGYQQNTPAPGTGTVLPGINNNIGLFALSASPTANYLVETDPRFSNYRTWLSSDYLLSALNLDPSQLQKRLGDGFYEQRLVTEQVAQLTGRRFLGNDSSNDAQFQALMDAGVTTAQAFNLRPGIALTASQMAALTSDIVWLVEQTVTVPDGQGGTTQAHALVPQVYIAHLQAGDLNGSGALLSGQSVQLNLTGDLSNSGTVAGRTIVSLNAQNVQNLGGRITGDAVYLNAQNDINNTGGQMDAASGLNLQAGRDINTTSSSRSSSNAQGSQTHIDRVAGLYVSGAGGTLQLSAGRDATLIAADLQNQGSGGTLIAANNNLTLGTVSQSSSNRIVWNGNNSRSESSQVDSGSSLQTQGDLTLQAGNTLNATAAQLTSVQGNITLTAGQDVNLSAGQAQVQVDEAHQHKSRSNPLSSTTITTRDTLNQTTAQASVLSGQRVTVRADQNIHLTGSQVLSDHNTTLVAQGNLTMAAAHNSTIESHEKDEKKSGVFSGGGLGITIGTRQQSTDQQNTRTSASASTVGSIKGDVNLSAGKAYQQTGSDVMAPAGNVTIQAQSVTIEEARETSQSATEQKFKQTGISIGISNPLISAAQTAQSMGQAAGNTSDPRMQALAAAAVGLNGYNTYNSLTDKAGNFSPKKAQDISVNISIGSSKSQSNSNSQSDSARGSTVTAGNNINITATGANQDSNLTVQGSEITAGNNVNLNADNQINLQAAKNTASQTSSNSSSSSSVGVSYSPATGWGVNASASRGHGRGNGEDTSYTNTNVQAGHAASLNSGGDTNIKGAVVAGNTVKANVGGNLAVESLQDTSTYTSRQSSSGGSISVGGDKLGGGISVGRSNIDSTYQSVNQQSGIQSGDGGFQVNLNNNTDLKGAVIASTQAAIDQNRNSFTTGGTLTTSDIQNSAEYKGEAIAVSASIGPKNTDPKGNTTYLPGVGFGIGGDKGSAQSTTTAGISGIAGNTAVRTGDAQTGIAPIFDAGKVQREIDAQVTITQAFTKEAPKAVATFAESKFNEFKITNPQEAKKWDEGGVYRVALHTLMGAFGGGANGALGAAASASAANVMNEFQGSIQQSLESAGLSQDTAKAFAQGVATLTAAGIGAAVGGGQGAATAVTVDVNNRQLHPREVPFLGDKERVKRYIAYMKDKGTNLTELEAQKALSQYGAAMADLGWTQINGRDAATESFILSEAAKTKDFYVDNQGKQRQFFAVTAEDYKNELVNLKPLFSAYETNPQVKQFLENNFDKTRLDTWAADYKAGQQAGYLDASKNASLLGDAQTLLSALKQAPAYIIDSVTSSEVGPFDDAQMKAYYQTLLKLQGRGKEAGYVSEYDWTTTQRLTLLGIPAAEVGGVLVGGLVKLPGALARANGASGGRITRGPGVPGEIIGDLAPDGTVVFRPATGNQLTTTGGNGSASGTGTSTGGVPALTGGVTKGSAIAAGEFAGTSDQVFPGVTKGFYNPTGPVFGQATGDSCAAGCTRMAAVPNVPEFYIRDAIGTQANQGTNLVNIPTGLKDLGYKGNALYTANATVDTIAQQTAAGNAVIVNVKTPGGDVHAIVVDSISNGTAYIRDPLPMPGSGGSGGSAYSIPANALKNQMTGKAVYISPSSPEKR